MTLVLLCIRIICIILDFFQDIPIKTGCKIFQHFIISIRKHPGAHLQVAKLFLWPISWKIITVLRWYENCRTYREKGAWEQEWFHRKDFNLTIVILFCKLSTFNFYLFRTKLASSLLCVSVRPYVGYTIGYWHAKYPCLPPCH